MERSKSVSYMRDMNVANYIQAALMVVSYFKQNKIDITF